MHPLRAVRLAMTSNDALPVPGTPDCTGRCTVEESGIRNQESIWTDLASKSRFLQLD